MPYSKEEIRLKFVERFNALMEEQDIQNKELAFHLKKSDALIHRWRHGLSFPTIADLLGIAEFTHTSIEFLLGNTPKITDMPHLPKILPNQREADRVLVDYIKRRRPESVFFIQYSATKVENVVYTAVEHDCQIYLLVKHPNYVTSHPQSNVDPIAEFQREKISTNLKTMLYTGDHRLASNPKFKARCYWFPGALRAVFIGSPFTASLRRLVGQAESRSPKEPNGLLSLTTYRYTKNFEGVLGASNPLLHVHVNTDEGREMYRLFEETFVELWENSVSATEVIPPPG